MLRTNEPPPSPSELFTSVTDRQTDAFLEVSIYGSKDLMLLDRSTYSDYKSFIYLKIQTIVNLKNIQFLDENRQFTPIRARCTANKSILKLFECTTVFVRIIHEQIIIFVT